MPTRIATFHGVHDARDIAEITGIIEGHQIAEFIEGEFLRITQAMEKYFHLTAIGFAAENRASVRCLETHAFFADHVEAAIADAPIQSAIRTTNDAVHVVAHHAEADAESGEQLLAHLRLFVAIAVFEVPQVGNAGQKNFIIIGQRTEREAIFGIAEAVDDIVVTLIRNPIALGGFQQDDPVTDARVLVFGFIGQQHLPTIVDGLQGEVFQSELPRTTNIDNRSIAQTRAFDYVETALFIDGETGRVVHQWFGGDLIADQAVHQQLPFKRWFGVVFRVQGGQR